MIIRILSLLAIALPGFTGALAQPLPTPNPYAQKALDAKGITYAEWLLFEGIQKFHVDWITAGLDKGADPNKARSPYHDLSPLMSSVNIPGAKVEIVAMLLKRGADVNQRWTPALDCDKSDLSAVERAYCRGLARIQPTGYFPLYNAARYSNAAVVEELLKNGADVHARVSHGGTALHATHDIEIAKVLIRYGADINAKNNVGETVLRQSKQILAQFDKQPTHYLRPKLQAYCAWLESQGAKE